MIWHANSQQTPQKTRGEHGKHKSGIPLIKGLRIRKNITVSNIKLTLSLCVGFISFQLTEDEGFSVNTRAIRGPPKTNPGLKVHRGRAWGQMHACIDYQTKVFLVVHTDDFGWNFCCFVISLLWNCLLAVCHTSVYFNKRTFKITFKFLFNMLLKVILKISLLK